MTIFELVKIALDQLYADGAATHGAQLDSKIVESIRYLTRSYQRLNDAGRELVDYRDPAIRFAYVYKYVAAHGDYTVQVLNKLRRDLGKPIFRERHLRVSCVGGGPGSDIIAVLKYLNENEDEPVEKVICYLLDAEQAWADAWTELDESFDSEVALNANFQPLNVVDKDSWRSQKKFLQADLFTMIYFVSEVMSLDEDGLVTKFWGRLFREAKRGALFLFLDNAHSSFTDYFDGLCTDAGLKTLLAEVDHRMLPRFSEQSSEVAEYNAKFHHNPKIQSDLAFRVLVKP